MKIPEKINIAGREIKIEYTEGKQLTKLNVNGQAEYHEQKIVLNKRDELGTCQESVNVTFIHEIVHWILYVTGTEPPDEETFVSKFSEILYQVIKQLKESDK